MTLSIAKRRSDGILFRLILLWTALLALTSAFNFSYFFFAEGTAGPSKRALVGLLTLRQAGFGDFLHLLAYCVTILAMPMLFLAGQVLIERWAAGGPSPRASDGLIWPVRWLFHALITGALTMLTLLDWNPAPMHIVTLGSGSALEWLTLLFLYIVWLIAADIIYYWVHRAEHHFAWMWRLHSVHHAQDDLDVLHNVIHPVEGFIRYVLITIPLVTLVKIDGAAIFIMVALMTIQTKLSHMRAPINFGPLGHLIVDNRYHFIHHSRDPAHYNRNFADRFPFIDRMFGTYLAPGAELPETGLADRSPPRTMLQYLLAHCPRHDAPEMPVRQLTPQKL